MSTISKRNKRRHDRSSRAAFTLLELLLVLVLIGISAATIVPHLNGTLGRWQLRETAYNLQATLQLASCWARTRQGAILFVLDIQRGAFTLRPLAGDQPGNAAGFNLGWQSFGQTVEITEMAGLTDTGQERTLTFQPDGTSPPATIGLTGARMDANRETLWELTLDGWGGVQCQEKRANEMAR